MLMKAKQIDKYNLKSLFLLSLDHINILKHIDRHHVLLCWTFPLKIFSVLSEVKVLSVNKITGQPNFGVLVGLQ